MTRAFAALALLLVAACSEFRTGAAPDADSGAPDASSSADAAEPTTVPFCQTISPAPFFCADFEGDDVRAGWKNEGLNPDLGESGGGETERADLEADAPAELGRHAARFSVPPLVSTSKNAKAHLFLDLPRARELAIMFKLRIVSESFEPQSRLAFFSLDFGLANASVGALLVSRSLNATQATLFSGNVGGSLLGDRALRVLPVNKWIDFQVLTTRRDGVEYLAVRIEDKTSAEFDLPADFLPNPLLLQLGLPLAAGPMEGARYELDNVRIYLTRD